jgi:hypothetical protein
MRRPPTLLATSGRILLGGTLLLTIAHALPTSTAHAEGVMPPPPGLSTTPDTPSIARRVIVQYNLVIYPAYLSWLQKANGQVDSAGTFVMFLQSMHLSTYDRACYLQCYLMYND